MTAQGIAWRLANAGLRSSAGELAVRITYHQVQCRVAGCGALADRASLLNKLRGAFGTALLAGACDEVRMRQPCRCSRTCAAEVFFGTKPTLPMTAGGGEIAKPFVLHAEPAGANDLLAGVSVFGFAEEWLPEARHALVAALREGVNWHALAGKDVFVPAHRAIGSPRSYQRSPRHDAQAPNSVTLSFVSGLDARNGDPFQEPVRVLDRLVRRTISMARWYDVEMTDNIVDIMHYTVSRLAVDADHLGAQQVRHVRRSGRTGDLYENPAIRCDLYVTGELEPLWPFLRIGEAIHVGRGAVAGLGRYRLVV